MPGASKSQIDRQLQRFSSCTAPEVTSPSFVAVRPRLISPPEAGTETLHYAECRGLPCGRSSPAIGTADSTVYSLRSSQLLDYGIRELGGAHRRWVVGVRPVSYTHLRAHETR